MKRFTILFFWACYALTYAQTVVNLPIDDDPTPTVEEVIENLDFTEVTSGLLVDAGLQLRAAELYDGVNLTDENRLDVNDFGYLYATLNNAVVDQASYLPAPDSTYMGSWHNYTAGDPIPLAALNFEYHRFDKKAIDNNLITETDGILYDVSGRPVSPYVPANSLALYN